MGGGGGGRRWDPEIWRPGPKIVLFTQELNTKATLGGVPQLPGYQFHLKFETKVDFAPVCRDLYRPTAHPVEQCVAVRPTLD